MNIMEKEFEQFKSEYSLTSTTEERKTVLLELMRNNLKKRSGKDCGSVLCVDGMERNLDSKTVEDLYAIDSALRADVRGRIVASNNDKLRENLLKQNKYNPQNQYPGK